MRIAINKRLLDNFLRYAKIDTRSDDNSETTANTKKQFNLAKFLESELKKLGLTDVELDENCYLMAALPSNSAERYPIIGLLAHMDTATDMRGENVTPRIVRNYDGNDIVLSIEDKVVLSSSVITTD